MNFRNFTLLLVAFVICCLAIVPSSRAADEPTKTPRLTLDFGLFTADNYYNETKLKDKLRISKSFYKVVLNSKLPFLTSPFAGFKINQVNELVACDNLTLIKQEFVEQLDCKPIEQHLVDQKQKSAGSNTKYVRRGSAKVKSKYPPLDLLKKYVQLYPLKEEIVQSNIQSALDENNIGKLNFVKPGWDLGYYFEVKLHRENLPFIVQCTGEFFLTTNRTTVFTRLRDEGYPEFVDEIGYLIDEARTNGYLLSFKTLSCSPEGVAGEDFSLVTDFLLVQKQNFPYTILRHYTRITPIESLLNFRTTINQTRDPEASEADPYNTTVKVMSISPITERYNFALKREYFRDGNLDAVSTSLSTPFGSLAMSDRWFADKIVKILSVGDIVNGEWEEMGMFEFSSEDEDKVTYSIRASKDLHNTLLKTLNNMIGGFLDAKVTDHEANVGTKVHDEL